MVVTIVPVTVLLAVPGNPLSLQLTLETKLGKLKPKVLKLAAGIA